MAVWLGTQTRKEIWKKLPIPKMRMTKEYQRQAPVQMIKEKSNGSNVYKKREESVVSNESNMI